MTASTQIVRADWVLPISGPPISRGEVVIEDGRIAAVRAATSVTGPDVDDFGEAILLPGLVNVHTHLDYTVMRGLLEDIDFFPWIRELTGRAASFTEEDWIASATWGAAEAVAGGVTTIGDCTFSGAAAVAARELGIGGTIYQEVFGIDEARTGDEIVAELRGRVKQMRVDLAGTRLRVGISPHAPYTVRPSLFRALAEYARAEDLPVCIHAAESQAEAELIRHGAGPFAEMYGRRGIEWSAPAGTTVRYLDGLGILGPRTLLVHGVQVSAADRAIVRDRGVAWAHCPKSNAKLGAGIAPLGIIRDLTAPTSAGGDAERARNESPPGTVPDRPAIHPDSFPGRVGLGSDSVASNNTMDLFEEMRFAVLVQRAARRRIGVLSAHEALDLATRGGARALGLDDEIGTLEPGKRADLCVVALGGLHSAPAYDPYSALVYAASAADVVCTYISGAPRYDARLGLRPEDRFPANDLAPVRERMHSSARKMRDWRPSP
jgi:cytosine/adenosine deaminase-related metal-dependent hydrolase